MRLFGQREVGVTPILPPRKNTDWDTTIDALGFTISSDTMRISKKDKWPQSKREATARDALSMAGKLWNLTYLIRAGRYVVWRLLPLTGLRNSGSSKKQNRTLGLGREFHADLLFWKWATGHELLVEGEAIGACYTAIQRPAKGHYLSNASFEAVGGFCVERKVFWRYDLPKELTAELKRKADRRETCSIT